MYNIMLQKIANLYKQNKDKTIAVLYMTCNIISINAYFIAHKVGDRNSADFGFFVANIGNFVLAVPFFIIWQYKKHKAFKNQTESEQQQIWRNYKARAKISILFLSFFITFVYIMPTLIKTSMLSNNPNVGIGYFINRFFPHVELSNITQSQLKVFSGFSVFVTAIMAQLMLGEKSTKDFYMFGVGYLIGSYIIFTSKGTANFDYSANIMVRIVPYIFLDSLTSVFGRYFSRLRVKYGMDILLIFIIDMLTFFAVGLFFVRINISSLSEMVHFLLHPYAILLTIMTTVQHCLKLFCQIEVPRLQTLITIDCFKIFLVWTFDYLYGKRDIKFISYSEVLGVVVISLSLYLAKHYKANKGKKKK